MNMITRTSAPAGSTSGLTARVAALPRADKALLRVLFGAALLALVLGLAGGFATALARAGALTFFPDDAYRLLTLHGVSVFFYWLTLIQAALLLVLAAAENGRGVLQPRLRGESDEFTSVGFALFAWAGFLVVSAIAATNAFLPGILWSLGAGPFPADHGTEWHILFHNLHYLPLMATVLVWYVLTEHLTGVKSIHGARMSKIVFAAYLVFVPPTSLYHMFLEPSLSESVRVVGSLLSLFVSVPTLLAFCIIVSSLEANARARGATGLFGWMRGLPWGNPAMANMGWAAVNLMLGITFAFVLIQEKLAPMLSDTFFVPGYFHFFAVGVLTQTFLAVLMVILPALGGAAPDAGHRHRRPSGVRGGGHRGRVHGRTAPGVRRELRRAGSCRMAGADG